MAGPRSAAPLWTPHAAGGGDDASGSISSSTSDGRLGARVDSPPLPPPARCASHAAAPGPPSPRPEALTEECRIITVRYPSLVLHHEGKRVALHELVSRL